MNAREIAEKILALPREQQEVPLVFEYYDDPESSIPIAVDMENIRFCESSFPTTEPHIQLSGS